jgi:hypothetical protein
MASKSLILLCCLALSGCYTGPCVAPDLLSPEPIRNCYYQLEVTDIGQNNFITAKVPANLHLLDKDNRPIEPFARPFPSRPTQEESNKVSNRAFTFHVIDLQEVQKPLEKGKIYEFVRKGNSPSLELVRERLPIQKP